MGFPGASDGKESACNAGDLGAIPGLGRYPGERNGNALQCSCLENPRDGRPWWATIYGVAQSRTRLKQLSSSSSSRATVWYCSSTPEQIPRENHGLRGCIHPSVHCSNQMIFLKHESGCVTPPTHPRCLHVAYGTKFKPRPLLAIHSPLPACRSLLWAPAVLRNCRRKPFT